MKWNTKTIGTIVTVGTLVIGTSLYADDKSKSSSSSSTSKSSSSSSTARTAPSTSTSTSTAQGLQRAQNYVDRIRLPDPPKVSTTITPQQAIDNYRKSGRPAGVYLPPKNIVVPPPAKVTEVPPSKLNPQGSRDVQRGLDQAKQNQSKKN